MVHPDGTVDTQGVVLTENREFAYAGTRPADVELAELLDRAAYPEIAAVVAAELAGEGYYGPACIDGMVLEDRTIIPVLEVNARTSMGLIGLALQARAAAVGLQAVLRHVPVRLDADASFERLARELRLRGLIFDGNDPGFLPVTAGTLIPPRGRLCVATFSHPSTGETELLGKLSDAAGAAGMHFYDTPLIG
jgi:hypothetical protein